MNYIEKEQNHIMQTYARFNLVIDKAKGSVCYDENGQDFVDFTSGIGVNSLGHANDDVILALTNQAKNLMHCSNLYYSKPMIELAEKLCNVSQLDKVFFSNSGAEANECAIKLARKYYHDKKGDDSTKCEIITLNNSFHGRTITTLAATGQDIFHHHFTPFTEGFVFANTDFDDIKSKVSDKTCAIMIELIQGEGGVNILETALVQQIDALCKQKDILLIIDEVQTGIGRTGEVFAFTLYDIVPDIVTLAKGLGAGLPIGACLASKKCSKTFSYSDHGSTFGGNPIACAAANVVLDKVKSGVFLKQIAEKGNYIAKKLQSFSSLENVRHLGLMIGASVKEKQVKDIVANALEQKVMVLSAKNNTLRLLPALNIEYEQIDIGLERLEKALSN